MNNGFNIQFGSLYCFRNVTKSCYRPDLSGDTETLMLFPGTMFVPLDLTNFKVRIGEQKWYKLKILLTNGEIWYTDLTQEVIEFLKPITV